MGRRCVAFWVDIETSDFVDVRSTYALSVRDLVEDNSHARCGVDDVSLIERKR